MEKGRKNKMVSASVSKSENKKFFYPQLNLAIVAESQEEADEKVADFLANKK